MAEGRACGRMCEWDAKWQIRGERREKDEDERRLQTVMESGTRERERERDGEIEQERPAATSLALMPAIQISQCTSNTISPSSCAVLAFSPDTSGHGRRIHARLYNI